jgi:hypothetical protein
MFLNLRNNSTTGNLTKMIFNDLTYKDHLDESYQTGRNDIDIAKGKKIYLR